MVLTLGPTISGIDFVDRPSNPGRKRTEERLPTLIEDLKGILDGQSQTDATFQSQRLYTRLSVREVRAQLIDQHGYTDEQLPEDEVLAFDNIIVNDSGHLIDLIGQRSPGEIVPVKIRRGSAELVLSVTLGKK